MEEWIRDPSQRRVKAAELRADRVERRQQIRDDLAERGRKREMARDIGLAINELVPPSMGPALADQFREDALGDVVRHIREHRLQELPVEKVPEILARRLDLYGITPVKEAGGKAPAPRVVQAEKTGERLKAQADRRRAASATAPASTGHVPGQTKPPKGSTLEETFEWLDQRTRAG